MKKIIIILIVLFLNISCTKQVQTQYGPDTFLKERYEVISFLNRSFSRLPEGAFLLTPESNIINVSWPGDNHIKSVIENQPWTNHTHYQILLDISEPLLTSFNQNNSDTMFAVILLDYYFSELLELDFHEAGMPNTLLFYPIKYAANTWSKRQNNISITGAVYINIEDENALITVDIAEYYFTNNLEKGSMRK